MLTAAIAAVAAGCWLSPTSLDRVTTELISFFGIQAAVILPAMIFTAGILRPEGLSLPEVQRYRKALRRQMIFWIVLLALDFLTAGSLIVGKATEWSIAGTVPRFGWSLDATPMLVGVTVFLGTLALLRMIPFIKGVTSLQAVNADLTEMAIKARNCSQIAETEKAATASPFKKPEGFGRIVGRQ